MTDGSKYPMETGPLWLITKPFILPPAYDVQ